MQKLYTTPGNDWRRPLSRFPGILGREIVHALGKNSKQWHTVYAFSRSKKEQYPSNVQHNFIDLTSDAKAMAQQLKGVEAEYVFFAAYLSKQSEQENWDVNGTIFTVQVVQDRAQAEQVPC